MDVVHPMYFFRLLNDRNIQVHHHGLLTAAAQDAGERLGVARVYFLMRDVGRDVDEVAGAGFGHELELVAPAHAGLAAHHVDHALYRAVMVGAGLGLGVDDDGAGPEFLGAGARVGDGGGAVHARGLRGVDVELVGVDDAHAVVLPLGLVVIVVAAHGAR